MEKVLQRMRLSVKNNYSTISAKIMLLLFAMEQFRPRSCYYFSQQNNFGQHCAIYICDRTISAEIVLYTFAVAQKSTKLCYRGRRQNRKVRNCATAFGDRTEKYEIVLPRSEIEQKSTKLCYRVRRQNRKVRNCATARGDRTEKYETVLPHAEIEQFRPRLCYLQIQQKISNTWKVIFQVFDKFVEIKYIIIDYRSRSRCRDRFYGNRIRSIICTHITTQPRGIDMRKLGTPVHTLICSNHIRNSTVGWELRLPSSIAARK